MSACACLSPPRSPWRRVTAGLRRNAAAPQTNISRVASPTLPTSPLLETWPRRLAAESIVAQGGGGGPRRETGATTVAEWGRACSPWMLSSPCRHALPLEHGGEMPPGKCGWPCRNGVSSCFGSPQVLDMGSGMPHPCRTACSLGCPWEWVGRWPPLPRCVGRARAEHDDVVARRCFGRHTKRHDTLHYCFGSAVVDLQCPTDAHMRPSKRLRAISRSQS